MANKAIVPRPSRNPAQPSLAPTKAKPAAPQSTGKPAMPTGSVVKGSPQRNKKKKQQQSSGNKNEETVSEPPSKKQEVVFSKKKPLPSNKMSNSGRHQQQQPQVRKQVMPSKARRVARRKDISSMTDALQKAQVDLELSTSPTSSVSSSSGESDLPDHFNTGRVKLGRSKSQRPSSSSSGSSSTTTTPQTKPGPNAFPPLQGKRRPEPRRRASSVIDFGSKVYAGPTFNNVPAPSALPTPAFIPVDQRNPLPNYTYDHDGVFALDDYYYSHYEQRQQQQQEPASIWNTRRYERPMSLKSHCWDADSALSEIQRGLRTMLRIEAS